MFCIQYIENRETLADAYRLLESLRTQEGFLGGRTLNPCDVVGKDTWRVQAFFEAGGGVNADTLLPDGMRYIFVPKALQATMRFLEIK